MKVKSFNDEKNEFEGEAYFGITDMAKDKQKAEKEKFTKKAVTLYLKTGEESIITRLNVEWLRVFCMQ